MHYRKIEYKFKLSDLINPSQEYHLWICSFSLALQDLLKTHKLMFSLSESKEFPDYLFYFYKISLGFIKESIDLIESSLSSSSKDKLQSIPWFNEKYNELCELIANDQQFGFVKSVIDESRNKIFHYNNFYLRNDAKTVKKLLSELEKENFESSLVISGEDPFNNDLRFAEDIQINQLSKILEKKTNSMDIQSKLHKVSKVMADVINVLRIIVHDFVAENRSNSKIRKIYYK